MFLENMSLLMCFDVYFDCILNEIFFFYLEIMMSAAHMLGGMLPFDKFFLMCNLMRLGEYFDAILY